MNDARTTVVGNVATAPQVRHLESGSRVTRFRLAFTPRRFDRRVDAWVDGATAFLSVECWAGLGENVILSIGKGQRVVVSGRLVPETYERDGRQVTEFKIVAESVGHDLAWGTSTFRKVVRSRPEATGAEDAAGPAPSAEVPDLEQPGYDAASDDAADDAADDAGDDAADGADGGAADDRGQREPELV